MKRLVFLGIDFFLHTSLSYIVVDVILHATKPQFRKDHIVVTRPFQQNGKKWNIPFTSETPALTRINFRDSCTAFQPE